MCCFALNLVLSENKKGVMLSFLLLLMDNTIRLQSSAPLTDKMRSSTVAMPRPSTLSIPPSICVTFGATKGCSTMRPPAQYIILALVDERLYVFIRQRFDFNHGFVDSQLLPSAGHVRDKDAAHR